VPVRAEPKQADGDDAGDDPDGGDVLDDPGDAPAQAAPPSRQRKRFFARSHLLVTVPIYARWQVLNWEDR
jgi:hypothetical protein